MSRKISRGEYMKALKTLPIENPTPEDMAMVCPHLTLEEAVAAFNSGSGFVACPPVRVSGAFQIISFTKAEGKHHARLNGYYAGRILQSYANGRSRNDIFRDYPYMIEAMRYAEENWPSYLILDHWESVMAVYIEDPIDLEKEGTFKGHPKTKEVLYVCLKPKDSKHVYDSPESVLFDEIIVEITNDPLVWIELKGGRNYTERFNCAICGSGLEISRCPGCGNSFQDDHGSVRWDMPLSKKMVEFLQSLGHIFIVNPQIAWNREEEKFKIQQERNKKVNIKSNGRN